MGNALIVRSSNATTRTTWPWRYGASVKPLALAVLLALLDGHALADTWKCPHPKYGTIYQDHPGEHCKRAKLKPLGEMDREHLYMGGSEPSASESDVDAPAAPPPARHGFVVFPVNALREIPVLMVHRTTKPNIANATQGDGALVQIMVSTIASGRGPRIRTDYTFQDGVEESLRTAAYAAARATRFDPRFLNIEMRMPMTWVARLLNAGFRLDGPSAGVAFAVAVASAIQGDGLASGICFSGTISGNGDIGPVGGLVEKLDGCRYIGGSKLIVPPGQVNLDVDARRSNLNIQIATAGSLSEAYQLATGRPLRDLTAE